ncbi:hypothetical protein H5410_002059 [Solanum commersonii]|uniref:Pectinesterase catalytic domain-containing protein n=1 Tax=Solanum commersonii TaxID=4109 RepID=A0A9J6B0T6_SOLCO|nr:hypothetical protein H5410_002059 [Solanum commersonii]
MESYIDNLIDPKGWVEWIGSANKSVVNRRSYYLEYKNRGPGVVTKGRVTWASVTTDPNIASDFTIRNFISGDQKVNTTADSLAKYGAIEDSSMIFTNSPQMPSMTQGNYLNGQGQPPYCLYHVSAILLPEVKVLSPLM